MVEVISIYGTQLWVRILPDADFETYGYYYEIYLDENGDSLLDSGDTYDKDYDSALEWACNWAEQIEYRQ